MGLHWRGSLGRASEAMLYLRGVYVCVCVCVCVCG